MRIMGRLMVSALLLLCAGTAVAETVAFEDQVAQAITHDLGIGVQDAKWGRDIKILGSALRVAERARLRVATVHAIPGAHTWLLRMECGSRIDCLPFEVALRPGTPEMKRLLDAGRPSSSGQGEAVAAPLVRSGQRVLLAEEVSGMRLSTPAVCLQAGRLGQRIRARNVSSRRVVLARVRSAGQLVVEE